MRYLGLFNGVRSWLIIEKKRLIRYLAAIPGNRRRAWCLFIGPVNNWRQLSFWHVSVSNASLSRVGYLVLSVEKKEANLEVIRHHHHHEMCQYKISCKATQKYWFFYWNKQFENIGHPMCNMKQHRENWNNIDINSLVCKCDLFYIIFNEIANFLKQLAENVIYM